MPRAFWYNCTIACLLLLSVAFITAGRTSYESNLLYGTFSSSPSALSISSILISFALIFAVGRLSMMLMKSTSNESYAALYAIALFAPFVFLSGRFAGDLLAVLLLILALSDLIQTAFSRKCAVISAIYLAIACVISSPIVIVSILFPLYMLLKRKWMEIPLFIASLVASWLILAVLYKYFSFIHGFLPGALSSEGGIHLQYNGTYTFRGLVGAFRSSVELQLLACYLPFLMIASVALTVRQTNFDRAAVFVVILLAALLYFAIPAASEETNELRPLFMAACVAVPLAAANGFTLFQKFDRGRLTPAWKILIGVLFLSPVFLSFI